MFAILISKETIPKITERYGYPPELEFNYDMFVKAKARFYIIGGYVPSRGGFIDWVIQPGHIFEEIFEYDPMTINTDWTQIVRK